MVSVAKFNLEWLLFNSILWGIGFAVGLSVGFIIPVIGDLISVLVFASIIIFYHSKTLQTKFPKIDRYASYTSWGVLIGIIISFLSILFAQNLIGLSLTHALGIPITLGVVVLIQKKSFSAVSANPAKYSLFSFLGILDGFIVIWVLNMFVDLRLDLLAVRVQDYSAVIIWFAIGIIFGLAYGIGSLIAFISFENEEI